MRTMLPYMQAMLTCLGVDCRETLTWTPLVEEGAASS